MAVIDQPPSCCQAVANATSTAADDDSPAPRGTSEASAASSPLTASLRSLKDQATPAG